MNNEIPVLPNQEADNGQDFHPEIQIPQKPETPWHGSIKTALISIWLYLGSQMGISAVLSVLVGVLAATAVVLNEGFGPDSGVEDVLSNLVMLITSVLSAVLVYLYARKREHISLKKEIQENRYKKSDLFFGVCTAYGLSIPLGFVTAFLSMLLGFFGFGIPEAGASTATTWGGEILYILMAVVAAPVCEEIIFRGVILESLKKYSPLFALVFSSLLFALAHMNLYQGIGVMGVGLATGFMYLKTGSLQASIFIHFINNLIAVASDYIPLEFSWILEAVLLVMMAIGWWYVYASRRMLSNLSLTSQMAAKMWKFSGTQASFWLLVVFFAVMSVTSIITGV